MTKKILFATAIVAMMSSCAKDEVVGVNRGNEISFRPSLDKMSTRGTVLNKENLNNFYITAFGDITNKNYFTNLSVKSSDKGNTWTPDATYYWPAENLSFFAYAPTDISSKVTINNTTQMITAYSPDQDVDNQKDILISYNTGNRANNEKSGVEMNFKHALSQIEVKALCDNPKIKIRIAGIRIVNPATQGDFIFPTTKTEMQTSLPQSQWTNLQGKDVATKAYSIFNTTQPVLLTNNATSIMFGKTNFMLIPQQLTKWNGTTAKDGAYLSVLCRITSVNEKDEEILLYPQPVAGDLKPNKYAYSAVGIDNNWEPGKKYTYTLNFCSNGGGAGEGDPNPTPTPDTDVVDPNPGVEPGDPVLGAPIKVTVTVDDWKDQPETPNLQ